MWRIRASSDAGHAENGHHKANRAALEFIEVVPCSLAPMSVTFRRRVVFEVKCPFAIDAIATVYNADPGRVGAPVVLSTHSDEPRDTPLNRLLAAKKRITTQRAPIGVEKQKIAESMINKK